MSQPVQQVQHLDQEEQKHQQQIASHVTAATNTYTAPSAVVPAINQPVQPVVQSVAAEPVAVASEGHEPEIIDIIKGFQGKMRTGKANDFLNEKMKWISKKGGGVPVTLK